eukprot:5230046-Amphidinium_carterae.1
MSNSPVASPMLPHLAADATRDAKDPLAIDPPVGHPAVSLAAVARVDNKKAFLPCHTYLSRSENCSSLRSCFANTLSIYAMTNSV